jgi:BirA family biotin operon repressor/biotin-[acetyl-CoA-carboxylase] ligase
VKWPNDLILDGAKLAGVLSELAFDPRRAATLVVGVGLNLWLDAAGAAAIGARGLPATSMAAHLEPSHLAAQREVLLARLATALVAAVDAVAAHGFAPWRAGFDALFAWRGRGVELRDRAAVVASGTAQGVDDEGCLVIAGPAGLSRFASGDLSLRLMTAAQ